MNSAIATATPCPTTLPSGSSSTLAIAGSPRKPIPSEAIVMPSWHADRYSSMWSICRSTRLALRLPSSRSCSMRDSRVRTRGNSAATKTPFAATSTSTASRNSSSVIGCRRLSAGYFEEVRRRSFGGWGESTNSPCQLEVVLREAALGVARDPDGDLLPRDLEVGVVIHVLRLRRQPVHEVHRALEVVEREGATDRFLLTLPAVEPTQALVDLLVAQTCHSRLHAHRFACAIGDRDALRPRPGRPGGRGHPRV